MKMSIVRIDRMSKYFSQGKSSTRKVFDNACLDIPQLQRTGLMGESGSGKSTLTRILLKMETISSGSVIVNGFDLTKKNIDIKRYYGSVQTIHQNSYETFDNIYTVGQSLLEVMQIHRIGGTKAQRRELALMHLANAGFQNASIIFDRHPNELSGGQLQKIAFIRAVMLSPKLLLADEPITMLDVVSRNEMLELMQAQVLERGITLLYISHDVATMKYITDVQYSIEDYRIVEYAQ